MSVAILTTRERILNAALIEASLEGLRGLSLGRLASLLGLSKPGVVLPFGNKQGLQMAVLEAAMARFTTAVFTPSLQAPRGLPRLVAIFRYWLDWVETADGLPGGCPLIPAMREWDDLPGPLQDRLRDSHAQWVGTLEEFARRAMRQGHLDNAGDPGLIAFQLYGLILEAQQHARLLHDAAWRRHAETAFSQLLARHRAAPLAAFQYAQASPDNA